MTASHAQPARPRLLLTGFGPFGGGRRNPSEQILPAVAAALSDEAEVVTAVLPVEYAAATAEIRRLIGAHSPGLVVSLGLAGGRQAIGVERVAINLAEARIPDESGAQPIDEPLVAGAPPAHFASLPVLAMAEAIVAAGLPGEVSYSAGTFVCNAVMFAALDELASAARHRSSDGALLPRAGFVHVPDSLEAAAALSGESADDDAEAGSGESAASPAPSAPAQTRRLPEAEIARGVVAAVRAALSGEPRAAGSSAVGALD